MHKKDITGCINVVSGIKRSHNPIHKLSLHLA